MLRMENCVNCVANTEFQAIVSFQLFAIDALAINERTVFAVLVLNKKRPVLRNQQSMLARDARVGDHQVLVHSATDAERRVVESHRSLLRAVNENQTRKKTRTDARVEVSGFSAHIGHY